MVESICRSSVTFAQWSRLTQRLPLGELVIDPYTCSEVLRLHLLASGGYSDSALRKRFRSYRRGGYTDGDNPIITLRLRRPDLLTTLSKTSVYDLSPQDKLEVLSSLCDQLLTFSVARDHIEESVGQGKRVRRRIRELQYGEERRKRENRQQKAKERKEKGKRLLGNTVSGTADNETVSTVDQSVPGAEATAAQPAAQPEVQVAGGRGEEEEEGGGAATPDDGPRETEEERRERLEQEMASLNEELAEAMNSVNIQPLGADRHHNRYWIFPNLPGILMEESGRSTVRRAPPTSPPPLIYIPSSPITPSHDTHTASPDEPEPLHPITTVTTTQPPPLHPTHSPTQPHSPTDKPHPPPAVESEGGVVKWYCYTTAEEVEELMAALDVRGVREKALREALALHQSNIQRTIAKCPFSSERRDRTRPSPPQSVHYDSGDQYLELYLREQILDTEEKIHLGNLGHLRGGVSREQWREQIENSGAAALVNAWREKDQGREEGEGREDGGEEEEEEGVKEEKMDVSTVDAPRQDSHTPPSLTNPHIQELSRALLAVEAGIEAKFLMPPLGNAVDSKKRKVRSSKKPPIVKEAEICREPWRASLSQASSFSQVFVHLATLERAIMWSRSLMNVRCRICRRKGGDEYMLLCDGCDHGYHTYCLKPPLQWVPEGDWFCHDCSPVTPVKPRKRTQRVTFQEVESSESEGEGVGGGGEDEGEESEEEEEEEEEEETDSEEVITTHSLRSRRRGGGGTTKRRSSRLHQKLQKKKTQSKPVGRGGKRGRKPKANNPSPPPKPTMKAKKKLPMAPPHPPSPASRAESVVSAIIELRCSRGGRGESGAMRREQRGLEMQLCEALWEEVSSHDCSWPFAEPVKKKEYPDYHSVVSEPIDLKTIRSKIKRGDYGSLDGLVADMELLFSNCQLFHRRHSEIGKAGLTLKRFFDQRCSDLGLKDLELVAGGGATGRSRLRRRK